MAGSIGILYAHTVFACQAIRYSGESCGVVFGVDFEMMRFISIEDVPLHHRRVLLDGRVKRRGGGLHAVVVLVVRGNFGDRQNANSLW